MREVIALGQAWQGAGLGALLLILAAATSWPEHRQGLGLSTCLLPGAYGRAAALRLETKQH